MKNEKIDSLLYFCGLCLDCFIFLCFVIVCIVFITTLFIKATTIYIYSVISWFIKKMNKTYKEKFPSLSMIPDIMFYDKDETIDKM